MSAAPRPPLRARCLTFIGGKSWPPSGGHFFITDDMFIAVETTTPAQLVTLGIAVFGLAGLIFTALKYNRDDTAAIVNQQNTILGDMKVLNDELRTTSESLRAERDSLRGEVRSLSQQINILRDQLESQDTGKFDDG